MSDWEQRVNETYKRYTDTSLTFQEKYLIGLELQDLQAELVKDRGWQLGQVVDERFKDE